MKNGNVCALNVPFHTSYIDHYLLLLRRSYPGTLQTLPARISWSPEAATLSLGGSKNCSLIDDQKKRNLKRSFYELLE